jgi:cysteine desulfurase / selenocysteine lyase
VDFARYRDEFPVTRKLNYLATGAEAPISTRVIRACNDYLEEVATEGGISPRISEKASEQMQGSKRLFSQMVNCDLDEVASVPSTSYAINMAALMIDPKPGDNLVINDLEFDSNLLPWLRYSEQGVEVRVAKNVDGVLAIEEIQKLVDEKTKVVTASHVSSWSGFRQDLKALSNLAHSQGALVVVDAANSVGAIETNLRESEVDFFTTSAHKWMLGPKGSGFLFVNRKIMDRFAPPLPGWYGVPSRTKIETVWKEVKFSKSASKYEVGTPSVISNVGVSASMKMLFEAGLSGVYKRISDLGDYAIGGFKKIGMKVITPTERERRGGAIVIMPKMNSKELHNKLTSMGIATLLMRTGGIQVYPAFFNTEKELDALIDVLRLG